jgi:regulator of sigma E protease
MLDFEIARALQVVFGIGLVIFVHELGHYLAARWCGVRVETFSLGFGPRLLGLRVGPTDYQIALVPLGGFCRMAGEERRLDGLPPEPDELPAKSVGARFFIYSGGVLMNLLFGLVVFPILFQVGVPFTRPVLGEMTPGGAAWLARLPAGHEIASVNGHELFEFEHLFTEVALGDPTRATLVTRDPRTGALTSHELRPVRDDDEGLSTIGVRPDLARDADGLPLLTVRPDSPAERAGLASGDGLLEVLGAAPGASPAEALSLAMSRSQVLELRVRGATGAERTVRVAPELSSELQPPRVGIAPRFNRVLALRPSPLLELLGLQPEDRLLALGATELVASGDFAAALLAAGGPSTLRVQRDARELELALPALTRDEALALASDVALGADEESSVVVVQPDEAAARAGLRTLDRVLAIDGVEVRVWQDVKHSVERAARGQRAASFRVSRPGAADHLTLEITPQAQPVPKYGLTLRQAEYVYRAPHFGAALVFGVRYSWRFLEDSWLTLKRMLTRDVSPKNVGGIITISAVSYGLTEAGWIKFFFFLCLVSINLAFLNVLPIPVLDGGHLFFLLVEKLKGSPVSNRVLGTSQAVGVVLLLSLMVYVTYNDLVRWVFPP